MYAIAAGSPRVIGVALTEGSLAAGNIPEEPFSHTPAIPLAESGSVGQSATGSIPTTQEPKSRRYRYAFVDSEGCAYEIRTTDGLHFDIERTQPSGERCAEGAPSNMPPHPETTKNMERNHPRRRILARWEHGKASRQACDNPGLRTTG